MHERAIGIDQELRRTGEILVTGWHTLIEFADGVRQRKGQRWAWRTTKGILESRRVRVESVEPVCADALELFEEMSDRDVDLSDCLSFALMRSLSIRRAFTFDRDFEKAGFELC